MFHIERKGNMDKYTFRFANWGGDDWQLKGNRPELFLKTVFLKILRKTHVLDSPFDKVERLNFIIKRFRHGCFPLNFATTKKVQNTFFTAHLWATASGNSLALSEKLGKLDNHYGFQKLIIAKFGMWYLKL